ncbi:hypothetical protein [Lederbergia citri]|uniref:Uncharacterized protein n=1 Tax=Lederbergia citri TaxID=2833580 RepID=A0A942TE70_9BACI|nr:hypothetical protein [Lederbergia citri]MBS4195178.1 hypothetical protein [Lederbergia citri]
MGIVKYCPCDCSATLKYFEGEGDTFYEANICPDCENPSGSSLTITSPDGTFFEAKSFNPTSCMTTPGGVLLVTSGEGISVPSGSDVYGYQRNLFSLFLQKSDIQVRFDLFFKSIDKNGSSYTTSIAKIVPEDAITITKCP